MLVHRVPRPELRPFVKTLWASGAMVTPGAEGAARELVLPTGAMHLVFRLSDDPLRLFDSVNDSVGRTIHHAVVGGACAAPYMRDISKPTRSVGAELRPGASEVLLGVPADELAGSHTALVDLWGPSAVEARERLLEANSAERQLDIFESLLAARLPRVRALHPVVAHALGRLAMNADVGEVVGETGYSHRRFIALFRREVGLTPKLHCRVLRFHTALDRIGVDRTASWADLALAAGYSDQAHFNREFREFAGITPGRYREVSPAWTRHVPIRSTT